MSHVTCPFCGSSDHTSGYGLAAGPMAQYTFCNTCDALIELTVDMDVGLTVKQLANLRKLQVEFDARIETRKGA